jgi:hypothetical protein
MERWNNAVNSITPGFQYSGFRVNPQQLGGATPFARRKFRA